VVSFLCLAVSVPIRAKLSRTPAGAFDLNQIFIRLVWSNSAADLRAKNHKPHHAVVPPPWRRFCQLEFRVSRTIWTFFGTAAPLVLPGQGGGVWGGGRGDLAFSRRRFSFKLSR